MDTHVGHNEYLAAIAAMPEQTASPAIQFGMRVTVPRVYGDGVQSGTVAKLEHDRHLGPMWLIDTPQGRLKYLPSEITCRGWPF